MKLKKIFLTSLVLGLGALTLAACSSKSGSAAKQDIIVATDSDTAPFTFTGKDNKQTGYDIEVMKAVFKDSKKYNVKFETTEFESILPGIDSDRYQIAANDFNYNADRANALRNTSSRTRFPCRIMLLSRSQAPNTIN